MANGKIGLAALYALFAVFVLSSCSSNTPQDVAGAPINENSTTEETQQYIDSAVAKGDVGMCLKIPNKMPTCLWTSSCLAQVAEHNKDAGICNKITKCPDAGEFDASDFAKEQCMSGVERAKSKEIAALGPDACLKLEDEKKNACLSDAALNKADYTICELIVSDDEARDTCLFNTIDDTMPENDVLCDKIKATDMKEICHKLFTVK